ncbi:MAG: DUF3800 domain-containing protein [Candidatus Peribacteraceae bacterium]|nr:DUF3800 domain-containing protein [Candidatus Peribacteraceae bacterium]
MAFIFMDESGDLGFDFSKKKTSKFFIVAFLFVPDDREVKAVQKIVKNVFVGFTKSELKHHSSSLHAFREKPATRRRLLTALARRKVSVLAIILNKERVYTKLQNEKPVLYNYVTNILLDRILRHNLVPIHGRVCLVAAKRETNVFLNQNFREYLETQASHHHRVQLGTSIRTPDEEKCLQVADCVSWALFRKYERDDGTYASIIQPIIEQERPLFS